MLSMADPIEKEMMEKCDNEDKEQQKSHKELIDKLKGKKAYDQLKPFIRPKFALYFGVIFLALSQEKDIVNGLAIGSMIGLLGAPLNDTYMQKAFPNTGKTNAAEILEYMIIYWDIIMIISALVYFIFQFLGKVFFGTLSYNLTYDIRKILYVNILTKNIGFFDHAENSTPVLSGVL